MGVQQLFELQRLADVLQHQIGLALIGRDDGDSADTADPLPQTTPGDDVPHAVQKHFVITDGEAAYGQKQPVFTQGVAGEAERQAEIALAILPNILALFLCHR